MKPYKSSKLHLAARHITKRQHKSSSSQNITSTKLFSMFQNKIYRTNKGVAMGSPISNTIAETFLQHHENTYIKQVLDMQYIQYYTRYVDDILIIYDNNKVTHEHITHQFNQVHNDIKFNLSYETKNIVNFLDLQIKRDTHNLHINIYRKPTTTLTLLYTTLQTTRRNINPQLTDITYHDCTYCH